MINLLIVGAVVIPVFLIACGTAPETEMRPTDPGIAEATVPPIAPTVRPVRPTAEPGSPNPAGPTTRTVEPTFRRPTVIGTIEATERPITVTPVPPPTPSAMATATPGPSAPPTDAAPTPPVDAVQQIARGKRLVERNSCLECHTIDGKPNFAPPLNGLSGSVRALEGGGEVTADDEYVRESIKDPNAKIVSGFNTDAMPKVFFSDAELAALVEYIESLE